MTRSNAAHRADGRHRRKRRPPTALAQAAAALALALVLAVLATNGTYALLSARSRVALVPATGSATATIVAGTANLTIGSPTTPATNLYPGETRAANIAVSTTGSVGLKLSVVSISGIAADGFSATVAAGPCSAATVPVTSGILESTVTPTLPATLCMRFGLAATAPATMIGAPGNIVVTLSGSQT